MNLSKGIRVSVVAAAAVAAQTEVDSSVLDMQGFDGVMFIALTGDATSGTVLTLAAKGNTANSTSGPTAITGASATYTATGASDADSKALLVDVYRPLLRYIFAALTRTTQNCVVGGILAIQYCTGHKPTVQDASVIAAAFAVGS